MGNGYPGPHWPLLLHQDHRLTRRDFLMPLEGGNSSLNAVLVMSGFDATFFEPVFYFVSLVRYRYSYSRVRMGL